MERLIFAQKQFDDFGIQYLAMLESAHLEMSSIVKTYNIQVISRMGGVIDQMRDIQLDVLRRIEERGSIINSSTAQCIINTKIELNSAVTEAGLVFVEVSTEINNNFNEHSTTLVYPLFKEITEFISNFEFEFLRTFATINAVTNIDQAINILLFEAINYDILFETYIYSIINDFSEWFLQSSQQNAGVFQNMESSLENFSSKSEAMKNSLQLCNPDEI